MRFWVLALDRVAAEERLLRTDLPSPTEVGVNLRQ